MTDKLTDAQAIELDRKNRAQWEKDHPGQPYHSHLTPRQQSMRDAERQESARADKQAQANQNNFDQQRMQDNRDNAEADAQTVEFNKLDAQAAKRPERRHNAPDTRPLPRIDRRHGAIDTRA